jgi:hypothetical protein
MRSKLREHDEISRTIRAKSGATDLVPAQRNARKLKNRQRGDVFHKKSKK